MINYELSMLRTHVVTTQMYNRFQSGKQLITPAVEYLLGSCTGQALLSMVVCMSSASQHGWETWFACTYGQDLAKLCAPVKPQKPRAAESLLAVLVKMAADAAARYEATPATGPSGKYKFIREMTAKALAEERDAIEYLLSLA